MQTTPKPLDGITVISLEHAIAAPFCTRQLADLGARVIKIERPNGGDFARGYDERANGLSSHFVWVNRSKESLALDIKQPEAQKAMCALLDKADVLVQNLAPGAAARLGLSYEVLHEKYPQLIVCDISGYGQSGPYSDKKAYDLLIQSESGFLSITGNEQEMVKTGNSIADISAGMYAYSAILSALILREKTGSGSHIDVSMLESLTEWMGYPLYYTYQDAPPPPRTGASHATIYPYGPFPTADGEVIFGLQNEREWQSFCQHVLEQPDLKDNVHFHNNRLRSANRHDLKTIIDGVLSTLSSEQVLARLDKAKIANGQVRQMRDVWNHPQFIERNRWRTIDTANGELPALLPPAQNNCFEYVMGKVPALGEDNEHILQELKLDQATQEILLAQTEKPLSASLNKETK